MPVAAALSAALLLFPGPAAAADDAADLAGHWGVVFTTRKLVRVPVLRDRPTASLAGPGMVTRRGPLFSMVLRDEEVPMEVENAVSLRIEADGRFTLMQQEERAVSPTNACRVRAGSKREGTARYANGRLVLQSSAGLHRSAACEGTPEDRREGARADVYLVRRDGAMLILTADDGTVWQLRKLAG